jgi:nitrate/nitrite transport system permease protein
MKKANAMPISRPSADTDTSLSIAVAPHASARTHEVARPHTNVAEIAKVTPRWRIWLHTFDAKAMLAVMLPPVLGIAVFIGLWALLAPCIHTSLGALPGPLDVLQQAVSLWHEHAALQAEKAAQAASGIPWSGAATFVDQIFTSLLTVALGFVLATVVAVPLGLLCGLSKLLNNPLVQIMKPVSPLAWLPIVTMVISSMLGGDGEPLLPKSLVISAITVTLCSLWPTLINSAIGAASIDNDLLNVGRVLRLSWRARLTKLVLPSALPYIFTGMRLSLGVGWMVLIAAEMLAQNPGLGKFVWDEFQNGSEKSLARIMVAVIAIGVIGFGLDRLMLLAQTLAGRQARS